MISCIGRHIKQSELPGLIDIAFLALHGTYGEDGQIQGILEGLNIPYTGSGIRACSIGIDKAFQKKLMEAAGHPCPKVLIIKRDVWKNGMHQSFFREALKSIGLPMVVRPANQGSSIGVSIIQKGETFADFERMINKAFFIQCIRKPVWASMSDQEKVEAIRDLTDIRNGIGLPLFCESKEIIHPEELLTFLDEAFESDTEEIILESKWSEHTVVVEEFITGKEFSCVVIRHPNGSPIALPPTEIVKQTDVFDYKSKYLPGLSRKETPIYLLDDKIESIRHACVELFNFLGFNTYARIDGFFQEDGTIYLNDPNTTSGMLPSSFFFHQAAEIGLNPSQFLTFILYTSLAECIDRQVDQPQYLPMLHSFDKKLAVFTKYQEKKIQVGVLFGGYSYERHISVESGRNIYEKLASSEKYLPIPLFLMGDNNGYSIYRLPIHLMLKDNADDIRDKILNYKVHPVIEKIRTEVSEITSKFSGGDSHFHPKKMTFDEMASELDFVFIALHGRPGEDGNVQSRLEEVDLPYNGSGPGTSIITIDKYETSKKLNAHGILTAHQYLLKKDEYVGHEAKTLYHLEETFSYPCVAKPVDDGCSSAVQVIRDRIHLKNYLNTLFRKEEEIENESLGILGLNQNDEFPQKEEALIENLIGPNGAKKFLEVTVGLLTSYRGDVLEYEIFEPSEALAGGEVLSLEEKFLAGEGLNITPARFGKNIDEYTYIARRVKSEIEKTAKTLGVKGYARIDAFVRVYENPKSRDHHH